jgi:2'-5' RNA ligase
MGVSRIGSKLSDHYFGATMRQNSRFAVYLIPPYHIARDVTEIHELLRKQFGFIAADQFQVHATIKGFFKMVPGPLEPLIERLDRIFTNQKPFPIYFNGTGGDQIGYWLDISQRDDKPNPDLLALRERVVEAVRPFIAPDCDFVEEDLGRPFVGHITLAFRDIPLELREQVSAYLQSAPLPQKSFIADTFHFLEFFSQDWSGDWEQTLTWRLHKSWRLGDE